MVSNLGFDNGHPYLEVGADEGVFFDEHSRVSASPMVPPATTRVTLERSLDGATWEPVVETDGFASLIDWESWSYGDIRYRVTAFTVEGAASVMIVTIEARSGVLWLSGGTGFSDTARLPYDPGVSITGGRARAMKWYAGRSLPVAYTGEELSRVVSVSGRVSDRDEDTADVESLVRLAQLPTDLFMFRDPDGRRVYGSIGNVQLPRQMAASHPDGWEGIWGYSFVLTEAEGQ